jgi:archaellum biogenesis protein FlaJ (TadC family)
MNIDTNIFNHFKSIHKTITKEEVIQYKEYLKEEENLVNKKYIKLESRKVRMLKQFYSYFSIKSIDEKIRITDDKLKNLQPSDVEFYKVFDYINDKKAYGKYKEFLNSVNEVDNNIKTIADI